MTWTEPLEPPVVEPFEAPVESRAPLIPPRPKHPWGFWATTGWSLVIGCAEIGLCLFLMVVFIVINKIMDPGLHLLSYIEGMASNGFFLIVNCVLGTPLLIILVLLLVSLRGFHPGEYIGNLKLPLRTTGLYLLLFILLMVLEELAAWMTNQTAGEEFMIDIYKTSKSVLFLAIALVVFAPLSEEVFFRGFMYKGFACSPLGPGGAIFLTSFLWAILHLQYNVFYMFVIFIGGLILGVARHKTGSILLPILLHAFMNLVATIQMVVEIEFFGH